MCLRDYHPSDRVVPGSTQLSEIMSRPHIPREKLTRAKTPWGISEQNEGLNVETHSVPALGPRGSVRLPDHPLFSHVRNQSGLPVDGSAHVVGAAFHRRLQEGPAGAGFPLA